MKKETTVSLGLAMFTMLFGAGNIVFPLLLGRNCGSQVWLALLGFGLTAVVLPIVGFIATVLCDGDFTRLLRHLGTVPGVVIGFLIMLLVGPLCAIPRCILLSYGTLKPLIPSVNLAVFSFCASAIVFVCSYRPSLIVKMFGRLFGPLKLFLIGFLVFKCFTLPAVISTDAIVHPFIEGIVAGYETMDLLGALVVTGLMAISMPWIIYGTNRTALRGIVKKSLTIGIIGGLALSLVYAGFGFAAARFSAVLHDVSSAELLMVLASNVLGRYGLLVASVIVLVTCLTTAMVLSAAVARYCEHSFRASGVSYGKYLLGTCLLAGVMSLVGFDGLMHIVEPAVLIIYPIVILLAVAVIVLKLKPHRSKKEHVAVGEFFGAGIHQTVTQRVSVATRAVEQSQAR